MLLVSKRLAVEVCMTESLHVFVLGGVRIPRCPDAQIPRFPDGGGNSGGDLDRQTLRSKTGHLLPMCRGIKYVAQEPPLQAELVLLFSFVQAAGMSTYFIKC